jgi:hypothetical protein
MRRVSPRTYCHCGPQKRKRKKKKTETANNDHQKTEERHEKMQL